MNSGVRQNKRGAHSRGYGDKVALEVCATSQLRLKCRDNMGYLALANDTECTQGNGQNQDDKDGLRRGHALLTEEPVYEADECGRNQLGANHIADVLQVNGNAADNRLRRNNDTDIGCDQSTDHKDTHYGGRVGQRIQAIAHGGDELHTLLIGHVGLLAAEPVNKDVHDDPDEDTQGVAVHGHIGSQSAENGREQRTEDGIADGSQRSHETSLETGNSLEALNALLFLDRQIDTGDDRVEEV